MTTPTDQTAVLEYYLEQILKLLKTLVAKEQQGFRIRVVQKQLSKIDKSELENAMQVLLMRIEQAADGMTMRELAAYMKEAGFPRIAKNLTTSNKRRMNPVAKLVEQRLVIMSYDNNSKYRMRRYWSRQWYLRKFAQLPDSWQTAEVEEALKPVDESNISD